MKVTITIHTLTMSTKVTTIISRDVTTGMILIIIVLMVTMILNTDSIGITKRLMNGLKRMGIITIIIKHMIIIVIIIIMKIVGGMDGEHIKLFIFTIYINYIKLIFFVCFNIKNIYVINDLY